MRRICQQVCSSKGKNYIRKNLNEFKDIEHFIILNQFGFIQTNDFVGTDTQIGKLNEVVIIELKDADIILIT